jgi:hypothetical protein
MSRVKVTGFIDPDDYGADPDDRTGLTADGYEQLHEDFGYKLQEFDAERVDDDG